jgi:nucleoside-diphosphate-sugar epimerase
MMVINAKMKIALMGGSGFIGSRMVEMFHLGGLGDILPIVRNYGGLARLARFDLDCKIADAFDEGALLSGFEGCKLVVHAVHGHPDVVEGSIAPSYRAACKAGVKRLVYLSSASVHGQAPACGTDEQSPLSDCQAEDYNNRKVRAERLLLKEREGGTTEVVILRPGVVFGPRDRWISGLAHELLRGTAYLVDGGAGICNSIYVDNLVHAIHLALTASEADGEAFLVGDAETVTWAELYQRIAAALGVGFEEIHCVTRPAFAKGLGQRVNDFRSSKAIQSILPIFPPKLKLAVKAGLTAWKEPPATSPWALSEVLAPEVTMEMADLQQCSFKLPQAKAEHILGYKPILTFEEGCRRSIAWLRCTGFPVCKES